MEEKLKNTLRTLAQKYETPDFLVKDPSQFMHRYESVVDQEVVAFTAANLAFGRRDQILEHVEYILQHWGSHPSQWVLDGEYKKIFTLGNRSFYRMYTHDDMNLFFEGLASIINNPSGNGTIGSIIKMQYQNSSKEIPLAGIVAANFSKECKLISHSKNGACKKLNMLLRWMVRDGSPVDLGLWSSWYSKKNLIMPLDVHVIQEAQKFGIFPKTASGKSQGASYKTARTLSDAMLEVFPEDPLKGDFALFGLGVDPGV